MITSKEVITTSKHFPRKLNGVFPTRPQYFSVDPAKFDVVRKPRLNFSILAKEGMQIVRQQTEEYQKEYSIVFLGKKESQSYYFDSFFAQQATKYGSFYSVKQKAAIAERLKQDDGEVIYGHTHVAHGLMYNHFSLMDLDYYVERSLEAERDIYAALITKDSCILIMYSYTEHEFFRVQN